MPHAEVVSIAAPLRSSTSAAKSAVIWLLRPASSNAFACADLLSGAVRPTEAAVWLIKQPIVLATDASDSDIAGVPAGEALVFAQLYSTTGPVRPARSSLRAARRRTWPRTITFL